MSIVLQSLAQQVASLAAQGVYIGTSSWKYTGWFGSLYDPARYVYRGKFAESRFNRNCLGEYAEVFKTVCIDAAYYTFPTRQWLEGMVEQTPNDFRFGLKVTDAITVKRFPNLARFGDKSGKLNENFLDAELFVNSFLAPCDLVRERIGLLVFEFSRFWPSDYAHGRDFITDLDKFLGQLPKGWPYAVELRNRYWLKPAYFSCLERHHVTHILNSWEAMPSVGEQMTLAGSRTNPNLVAARFLLKPGRSYEEAVKVFKPYDHIKEKNVEARSAGRALIAEGKAAGSAKRTFIFVNNRLEGNAISTIEAMLQASEIETFSPVSTWKSELGLFPDSSS